MGNKGRRSSGRPSFFSIPRGLKAVSGERRDTELQDHHHQQGQDFGKKYHACKAAKEGDKEKTEQADGGDRPG